MPKNVFISSELRSQRGQTLLIILMVMGLALAAGVAISSRSLQSLRQISYTGQSTECLFAAEAGVEDALKKLEEATVISDPNSFCTADDMDDASNATRIIDTDIDDDGVDDVRVCMREVEGVFDRTGLERDSTYQIPLRDSSHNNVEAVRIHWEGDAVATFAVVSKKVPEGTASLDHKGLFDPLVDGSCDAGGNNDPTSLGGGAPLEASYPSQFMDVDLSTYGYDSDDEVIMRLRFLCEGSSHVVVHGLNAVGGNQLRNLPKQYFSINSRCLNKPVVREIEATKSYPALPTIFDFVLFSGAEDKQLTH